MKLTRPPSEQPVVIRQALARLTDELELFLGAFSVDTSWAPTLTNGAVLNAWTTFGSKTYKAPRAGWLVLGWVTEHGFNGVVNDEYLRFNVTSPAVANAIAFEAVHSGHPAGVWDTLTLIGAWLVPKGDVAVDVQYFINASNLYVNNRAGATPVVAIFIPRF